MNEFSELIERLYREKLNIVSQNKSDPGLRTRFEAYMHQKYASFLEIINENPQVKQRVLEDWYQTELRHWGNLPDDAKYVHFTDDEALVEIDECSSLIFSIARKKYSSGHVSKEDAKTIDECLNKMTLLMPAVLRENMHTAQKLMSEAIVDSNYVCEETEIISMRLSKLTKYISKEKK